MIFATNSRLEEYMNEFFNETWFQTNSNYPPSNIFIKDDNLYFEFALAGIKKEDILIKIDPETYQLIIEYNKSDDENLNVKYLRRNLAQRNFNLRYKIPTCYNIDEIVVNMKNGLLHICFEKNENKKQRTITF